MASPYQAQAQGAGPWFLRTRNQVIAACSVLALFLLPWFVGNMWENLDAHEIMVIQSPIEGHLTVETTPGVKYQGFGNVTKYPRRATYEFSVAKSGADNTKKLRFNDGGHANLSGAVQWEMPLIPEQVILIHKAFGSAEGVEKAAVGRMIDAAVYLAGPLMSSTESSGERRSELVQYINDQAENGVYVTTVKEREVIDPITNVKKMVSVTVIERDKDGNQKRQQGSILGEFHIKLLPMSITELKYDAVVENQIKQRQEATTQVQIAIAQSKTAEQQALTIAKQGEANAASAKWKQETIKAQFVTEAQQKLEVATLAAREAEQFKRMKVLQGEGEAAYKRLVMEADGALQPKLDTVLAVHKVWAEAYAANTTQQVPSVIMGANGGGANGTAMGNVQTLMEVVAAKAAKDFAIDVSVGGKAATAGKKQ